MTRHTSTRLSERDVSTLSRAEDLQRRFDAGIFPIGPGGYRHFARLVRLGLLAFDGWGRDIDGEVERDVPVYRLTESGREALATEAA